MLARVCSDASHRRLKYPQTLLSNIKVVIRVFSLLCHLQTSAPPLAHADIMDVMSSVWNAAPVGANWFFFPVP